MAMYTKDDLDLFHKIQPQIKTDSLDRDTAVRFLALRWIRQAVFGEDKWELTEAGERQLRTSLGNAGNWRPDYKGYGIVVGRHLHNGGEAHYTITKPGPNGEPVDVHHSVCSGDFGENEPAWDKAYADAKAYIDANLPALE